MSPNYASDGEITLRILAARLTEAANNLDAVRWALSRDLTPAALARLDEHTRALSAWGVQCLVEARNVAAARATPAPPANGIDGTEGHEP